jgi:hypothetical protein
MGEWWVYLAYAGFERRVKVITSAAATSSQNGITLTRGLKFPRAPLFPEIRELSLFGSNDLTCDLSEAGPFCLDIELGPTSLALESRSPEFRG